MYNFEQIELSNIDLNEYNSFQNKSVFTRLEWIRFIIEDTKGKPIILRITREKVFIGYFSALMIRKFGINIIASPFRGWSTCFMGFDTDTGERLEILNDLKEYLFREFKCLYTEIIDRDISVEQAQAAGFDCAPVSTLELEIDKSEDEIFKSFKPDCRTYLRQFETRGAVLEHAVPDDKFAEEYYEQLKDVFAKQGMLPTYNVEKVKRLLHYLAGTDMLLCLRIRDPEGRSISSYIFLGYNNKFFIWGGASLRTYQKYRPNEYMIWYAIKYWHDRGYRVLDMVGVREFKLKFSPVEKQYARIMIPKYKILIKLRNIAQKSYYVMLKVKGFILGKK